MESMVCLKSFATVNLEQEQDISHVSSSLILFQLLPHMEEHISPKSQPPILLIPFIQVILGALQPSSQQEIFLKNMKCLHMLNDELNFMLQETEHFLFSLCDWLAFRMHRSVRILCNFFGVFHVLNKMARVFVGKMAFLEFLFCALAQCQFKMQKKQQMLSCLFGY